jgi:hypothetical protein
VSALAALAEGHFRRAPVDRVGFGGEVVVWIDLNGVFAEFVEGRDQLVEW